MKKYLFHACVLSLGFVALSSCKGSKESAYRAAYEQAVADRTATEVTPVQQASPIEVTPVTTAPAQTNVQTQPATRAVEDVTVRTENVTLVNGNGLKAYSVVVGSFGVQANAERQQSDLKRSGYDAQVVYNPANKMYRVIATTFATRDEAINSREQLRKSVNSDAWLLYSK